MSVASQQAKASSPGALQRIWRWILTHEGEPPAYDPGVMGRYALAVVTLMAIAYTVVMTLYTFGLQDTFTTHAEDLGIMDQALWNTAHGHFLYETICNPIGDLNCQGGVVRFAIHFEPILIPMALLYLALPQVKLLLFLQAVVVGSGVFPAYALATRRLRHPLWGVLIAALFLIYPPLTAAVVDDFHPEVFAATLLLWAFYFLTVRRYRALVICLVVTLLCKETMTLDVIGIGLFVALFHRRVRLGLGIALMGIVTLALALALMRIFSPLGHSPVTGRFSPLLHAPAQTMLAMLHDPARRNYLIKLLGPVGFLPLLSPWVAVIALPSVALNLLTNDPLMYSGLYQYNTDIAAVLIVASIDALAWIAPLVSRGMSTARARLRSAHAPSWLAALVRPQTLIVVALIPVLVVGLSGPALKIYQQLTVRHIWPTVTQHDRLGDQIAAEIPPDASVSAQSTLTPHVSQRHLVYQYPSGAEQADYVFLDVTTGNYYPFKGVRPYVDTVRQTLASRQFTIATAQDGYLLLKRVQGGAAGSAQLPASFYSFAYVDSLAGVHPVDVRFGNGLRLVGYRVDPPQVYRVEPELTITTYWEVTQPMDALQEADITLTPPVGGRMLINDSLTQEWLPPSVWAPGHIIQSQTWPIYLNPGRPGNYTLGVEVHTNVSGTQPPTIANVPVTLATPTGASGFPRLAPDGLSVALANVPLL